MAPDKSKAVAIFTDRVKCFAMEAATKISISVGAKQLAVAKNIARNEGISLSAVFVRGLQREVEAEERRQALDELVRDIPPVSISRQREVRASWARKSKAT